MPEVRQPGILTGLISDRDYLKTQKFLISATVICTRALFVLALLPFPPVP
jgi:hypothetical protein